MALIQVNFMSQSLMRTVPIQVILPVDKIAFPGMPVKEPRRLFLTSQGVGAPFGSGEEIMGYQACGLKGTVFIDVNEGSEKYPEKLTNISDGDEAVFRYVESGRPWKSIRLTASGRGTVQVFLGGKLVGAVKVDGEPAGISDTSKESGGRNRKAGSDMGSSATGHEAVYTGALCTGTGKYELVLRFTESEGLEIFGLILTCKHHDGFCL